MPRLVDNTASGRDHEGLLLQEAEFIRHYLASGNLTQAVIEAGYSKKGASKQGARLLARPDVKAAYDKARERILKQLEEGAVMNIDQARRALSLSIEAIVRRNSFRPQEVNALCNAVDKLGHISGWQQDNLNITGELGLPQILAGVAERVRARRAQEQAQKEGTA